MRNVRSWSFSRLSDYETCPHKLRLRVIERVPEPPRPLPPGILEHPIDRGTRVHNSAESFVRGGVELIPELEKFKDEFQDLRAKFAEGKVSLEGEWAFNETWGSTAWQSEDTWARIKLDALVTLTETEAVVIDYKTGKKTGNEVKHADQLHLYQLATFLKYPKLENITVELWYTDQDDVTSSEFSRAQGLKFFRGFDERARRLTNDVELKPRPNRFVCGRCPYKTVCEFSAANVVKKTMKTGFSHGGFVPWDG